MDFMRIMFGVVMLYVHGASASVYISTTSRGFTSTETGNPFFECYRSSPYVTAAVSRGRYVYVYNDMNDPANNDPPVSVPFTAGNPPVQAYRINLETSDHSSYGAFYCAASLDGERSVVPTIFLRSDARFAPTSGRFSKTVNKGDVDVTVDFTEVTPGVTGKVWRFNGTTDFAETISHDTILEELTVYTIIGEVETSHGGVYELHLMGERGQARAGLLRLIARACPAGRYNEPSGCAQICPSCYNGGICHDQTGICICPPGFQGDRCEIACGGNRYGRNCEYRCDYEIADDRTACSGLQVCVPDPYGCSCAPGYKGLNCTTECDQGEFGASCTETCHCVSGECDRFSGVCSGSSTECEPGWTGTNCQVAPAPTVSVEATSETVTVRWDAASPAHLNGDVQGYQLRYTQTKPVPLDPVIVDVMGNDYVITEGVTGDSQFEIEVRVLNGAGPGEWSPLMTTPLPGDESRYSLRALLLTGLIPSIILICIFCVFLSVVFFRRRQPDKGESEKNTHDETQSPGTDKTYQDLYERVSNDGTAYQELELTSVLQGGTEYINIEEAPRGRKNILKSIENADC